MIPARPTPPQSRPARDWTDTAIEWASGTTAVAMFAYGVALSYSVLHRIANAAGLPAWAADLWPLGFEAFMASAALNALADQRQRHHQAEWWQRVPWYPWVLTALTAGGSILLNWFHPATTPSRPSRTPAKTATAPTRPPRSAPCSQQRHPSPACVPPPSSRRPACP